MAKNLKLNIKNAQLAEALKLNQIKKPAPKKEDLVKKEPELQEKHDVKAEPSPVPQPIRQEPAAQPPQPMPVKEEPPAIEKTPVRIEPQPLAKEVPPPRPAPYRPSSYESRPYQKEPFTPRTSDTRFSRPGFTPGASRPPYSSEGRPRPSHGYDRPATGNYSQDSRAPRPHTDRPYTGYRPQPSTGGAPGAGPTRPGFPRRDFSSTPPFRRPLPPTKDLPIKEIPPTKKSTVDDFAKRTPPQKDSREGKETKSAKKGDQFRSFDARDRHGLRDTDDQVWRKKKNFKSKHDADQEEIIRPKTLSIRLPISVKDLAAEMKLKASQLIAKLFMQGVALTLNDLLDDETTVQLLGHEFECEISIDTKEEKRLQVTDKSIKLEIQETEPSLLHLRPPVVAFMGHVDHGKTSLIDSIRKSNRVAGEAGAITQHIGAFKCHTAVGDITILDTPGHEAFSAMRSRGADVTDIVVLVVAGDEGMKTQTLEALNQARDAGVPMVVAINKCDKPNFNAETVYRQLADQSLLPEAWGGATITVNCSAVSGEGIKELLEMLALQAEVLELRANPSSRARGTVIESEMHKGMGAVATILVQNGTMRIGDCIVFGHHYARIKTMHDEFSKELQAAGPSTPVKITGLSGLPVAGSDFIAVKDEKEARDISEKRSEGHKSSLLMQAKKGSLENLLQQKVDKVDKKTLHLILKADVQGSLEALKNSLFKIPSKKVEINIISEGVGEVSESDIQLAAASKATILGFHTKIESHAESLIKQLKVSVHLHDIIYHAVDDIKEVMLGLLDKIAQENEIGKAEVKAVFKSSQLGNIAGCQVIEGSIKRSCHVRILRGKEVLWKGPISSLKRVKEDVKEVSKGVECGIVLQGFQDLKEGDTIVAIEITYLTQDLN